MKKVVTLGVAAFAVAGLAGFGALNVSALNSQPNGNRTQTGIKNDTPRTQGNGNGQGQGYGRQTSLESRAKVLGMTADELQKALQTKTMSQIAAERGMTEDTFRTKMADAAKARWQARGLSDEEIAKRTADREKRHAANAADHEWGSGEGNRQGGYGRNR